MLEISCENLDMISGGNALDTVYGSIDGGAAYQSALSDAATAIENSVRCSESVANLVAGMTARGGGGAKNVIQMISAAEYCN